MTMDVATGREPAEAETADAERVFNASIIVSAIRCTLTYVIFPFVAPWIGLADVAPWLGLVVSVVAVVANVVSIRRMNRTQHRWRKPVTVINVAMIILVVALFADDLIDIVS